MGGGGPKKLITEAKKTATKKNDSKIFFIVCSITIMMDKFMINRIKSCYGLSEGKKINFVPLLF